MRRARMVGACLGALIGVCAAVEGPAQAATLAATEGRDTSHSSDKFRVVYEATAGEANQVVATWKPKDQTFTISDPGAVAILPSAGTGATPCAFLGRTVVCRPLNGYEVGQFILKLGDGDDSARLDAGGETSYLFGQGGDDTLVTPGLGFAYLHGGEGDDELRSGATRGFLHGGHGADRLDGGSGIDSYYALDHIVDPTRGEADWTYQLTTGVNVTLDGAADDGTPGEGDNVTGVEELSGTGHADTFVGDAGPQTIRSGDGDDRIVGGAGQDAVHAGGGDDLVEVRDGEADRYACDAGADTVLADPFDLFAGWPAGSCEIVEVQP